MEEEFQGDGRNLREKGGSGEELGKGRAARSATQQTPTHQFQYSCALDAGNLATKVQHPGPQELVAKLPNEDLLVQLFETFSRHGPFCRQVPRIGK
eukprot:1702930-Pyramimonas_sp.AAC.1